MHDRQGEVPCEGKVTTIMCGYSHHCSRAVTRQDIVTDPYGDRLAGERVLGIRTREYSRNTLICHAVSLGTTASRSEVLLYSLSLLRCSHLSYIVALGGKYHEGHPKDRISSGGEDRESAFTLLT